MEQALTRRSFLQLTGLAFGGCVVARGPVTIPRRRQMNTLTKVMLTDPNSVGNDGSQAFIYVKAGTPKKWRFHLQGGGLCYDYDTCLTRQLSKGTLMTYAGLLDSYTGTGILSRDSTVSPWWDYGAVYLHYGTSDLFDGKGDSGNWLFHGYDVVLDAMKYIKQLGVEELIFSGSSSGGIGVLACLDWVSDMFPQARVSGLCDAGWILDIAPYDQTLLSPREQLVDGVAYWHSGGTADRYLNSAYSNLVHKDKLFVQISQLDPPQLTALGIVDNDPDELVYVNAFSQRIIQSLIEQGVTGYYCPHTPTHGLALGSDWTRNLIGNLSLRDTFRRWYNNLPGSQQIGY